MNNKLPIHTDTHIKEGEWPGGGLIGWEWPVKWGYHITFKDGSHAYYPSWGQIPERIFTMQRDGYYEGVEISIWWKNER